MRGERGQRTNGLEALGLRFGARAFQERKNEIKKEKLKTFKWCLAVDGAQIKKRDACERPSCWTAADSFLPDCSSVL